MLNKKTARARERERERNDLLLRSVIAVFIRAPVAISIWCTISLGYYRLSQPTTTTTGTVENRNEKGRTKKSCEFLKSELVMGMGTNHARPVGEFLYFQFHSILFYSIEISIRVVAPLLLFAVEICCLCCSVTIAKI